MNQNRGNDHRKAAERICHDVQKHTMQVLVVVVATVAVRMAVVFIVVGATVAVVIAAVAVVIVGVAGTGCWRYGSADVPQHLPKSVDAKKES